MFVVLDAGLGAGAGRTGAGPGRPDFDPRFADRLREALTSAEPELRFKLSEAVRSLRDPLRDGGEGLRDFRVAAALGRIGPAPTDLIAIQAASAPASTVIKIRPARASSAFAGLMAPALEGLCSLSAPIARHDQQLLALAFVAHALAAAANFDQERTMDATSTGLVERLLAGMNSEASAATGAVTGAERAVLGAWADAWIGLAAGSTERLERARTALDQLAHDTSADLTAREIAQLQCNLAIVGLALGGTSDGSRRLADALVAARTARDAIAPEIEPATAMDLNALVGEIAVTLGIRRGDRRLLTEASSALTAALAPTLKSGGRRHWGELLSRAKSALSGRS